MMRILIADHYAIVRRGIKQILLEENHSHIIGEVEHAHQVVDEIRKHNWDLLILDINIPGRGALDILKEIRQIKPRLPVLVLSMHQEEPFVIRSLRAGASGYLPKESTPEEFLNAVRKLLKGERYISISLAEKLVFDLQEESEGPAHQALSNREFQVLCLIASGQTVSEISQQLHLSIKTVSTYRARILQKMQLKTNAALVHYAIKRGLFH